MNKTYEASRLSSSNRFFPDKVEIDDFGITVTIPGLFSKSQTISFDKIISVKTETPLIGFSKIIIDTRGWDRIVGTGFTKSDVDEMKQIIQQSKFPNRVNIGIDNFSSLQPTQNITHIIQESEAVQLKKLELERERELERKKESKEFEDSIKRGVKGIFKYFNIIGGVKRIFRFFKKYWKICVPILFIFICIVIYQNYTENKQETDALKIDLQLEQINDQIQIMISEHDNKNDILNQVVKLVNPYHIFSEKRLDYYDDYWSKIKEDYKTKLLNDTQKTNNVSNNDTISKTSIDTTKTTKDTSQSKPVVSVKQYNIDTILGKYTGKLNGSYDIIIQIDSVIGTKVLGYDIVNNNKRNLSGNYTEQDKEITLNLSEPGTLKTDGVFDIILQKSSFEGSGFWKMNNPNTMYSLKISKN